MHCLDSSKNPSEHPQSAVKPTRDVVVTIGFESISVTREKRPSPKIVQNHHNSSNECEHVGQRQVKSRRSSNSVAVSDTGQNEL